MKLYYNSTSDKENEIKVRMESMSLAFEKEEQFTQDPKLIDGKEAYFGISEIAKHLDKIAGELHNWYYCNC